MIIFADTVQIELERAERDGRFRFTGPARPFFLELADRGLSVRAELGKDELWQLRHAIDRLLVESEQDR